VGTTCTAQAACSWQYDATEPSVPGASSPTTRTVARRLRSTGWAVALGLVLGGALGNLADRVFRAPGPLRGHVVDVVSLFAPDGSVWPVFNLADSSIVSGGVLLVLLALTGRELDGTRAARHASAPPRPPQPARADREAGR